MNLRRYDKVTYSEVRQGFICMDACVLTCSISYCRDTYTTSSITPSPSPQPRRTAFKTH